MNMITGQKLCQAYITVFLVTVFQALATVYAASFMLTFEKLSHPHLCSVLPACFSRKSGFFKIFNPTNISIPLSQVTYQWEIYGINIFSENWNWRMSRTVVKECYLVQFPLQWARGAETKKSVKPITKDVPGDPCLSVSIIMDWQEIHSFKTAKIQAFAYHSKFTLMHACYNSAFQHSCSVLGILNSYSECLISWNQCLSGVTTKNSNVSSAIQTCLWLQIFISNDFGKLNKFVFIITTNLYGFHVMSFS